MEKTTTAALNTTTITPDGDQVPAWVELIPTGEVIGRDGRHWTNNNPQRIIQAFQNGRVDLPVDIEHSTELKAKQGDPAPAMGWVNELRVMNGAIWGRVDWNRSGHQLITTRQYRYLSPVLVCSKTNGAIVALSSVGLTNRPNLHLRALNSRGDGSGTAGTVRALNAMEREVCAKMGISEEEFLKVDPRNGSDHNTLNHMEGLTDLEHEICQRMGISGEEYLKTVA
nr:phage protease [uncultured Desulfobulbus sp.]